MEKGYRDSLLFHQITYIFKFHRFYSDSWNTPWKARNFVVAKRRRTASSSHFCPWTVCFTITATSALFQAFSVCSSTRLTSLMTAPIAIFSPLSLSIVTASSMAFSTNSGDTASTQEAYWDRISTWDCSFATRSSRPADRKSAMELADCESCFWIIVRMCGSVRGGVGDLRLLFMVERRVWGFFFFFFVEWLVSA